MSQTITKNNSIIKKLVFIILVLTVLLIFTMILGLSLGSTHNGFIPIVKVLLMLEDSDSTLSAIIFRIRLPRVIMAALVGAALSLGGLAFQALLRNPLAEPYILGVSGGSAIGAIIGILSGLARFPGISITSFIGSMITLFLVLVMSQGQSVLKKDSILLAGVMVNAFCSAVITFLISITNDDRLHNIMFWLMGDLSSANLSQAGYLFIMLIPCFLFFFFLSHSMNLLLMGKQMAMSMGVNIKMLTFSLLIVTSFMVSSTVSYCGLLGFVGLVIPHLLRLIVGPDHRLLVPACILGGGTYMVLCDILARTLPKQGEMPVGVVTAMIGAPVFILLLKKSKR